MCGAHYFRVELLGTHIQGRTELVPPTTAIVGVSYMSHDMSCEVELLELLFAFWMQLQQVGKFVLQNIAVQFK